MSNIPKGKLSYATMGKHKNQKPEDTKTLIHKQNDSIYHTILNGMDGIEKDYISDLINAKKKKQDRSTLIRNISDENIDKFNKQSFSKMTPSKLKHVKSMNQAQFLQQHSGHRFRSTNASIIMNEKSKENIHERETFIGSLDGYINRLQSTETSKVRHNDLDQDYEDKYRRLAEIYMDQMNSSKQKQQKLMRHIKKLKKYVKELQSKVQQKEQQQKRFATLWKRREDQFSILMGIQQELENHMNDNDLHICGMDDSSGLQLQSFEEPQDSNIRNTLKFHPEERTKKSRHTVNYY